MEYPRSRRRVKRSSQTNGILNEPQTRTIFILSGAILDTTMGPYMQSRSEDNKIVSRRHRYLFKRYQLLLFSLFPNRVQISLRLTKENYEKTNTTSLVTWRPYMQCSNRELLMSTQFHRQFLARQPQSYPGASRSCIEFQLPRSYLISIAKNAFLRLIISSIISGSSGVPPQIYTILLTSETVCTSYTSAPLWRGRFSHVSDRDIYSCKGQNESGRSARYLSQAWRNNSSRPIYVNPRFTPTHLGMAFPPVITQLTDTPLRLAVYHA